MPDFTKEPVLRVASRAEWRSWLESHGTSASAIWLIFSDWAGSRAITYIDCVEEAICFGWIDGIAKRISESDVGQRFTPRRPRSHWTELNKERARRLRRLGLMTPAGAQTLPDLDRGFTVAEDIRAAIRSIPQALRHFDTFPELYIRVRIGYIEEMRKQPHEFQKRLQTFLTQTSAGKMYGNWNDGGRLGSATIRG